MITLSPQEALRIWPAGSDVDHHRTGPPHCWQAPNHGSVSHTEGLILSGLARRYGGPILEIGADLGISTRYLHGGLDANGGPGGIVSVDYRHKWEEDPAWPRRIRVAADTRVGHPLIQKLAPYAWAFIDGDHTFSGVVTDIKLAAPLAPILVFHDTRPDIPVPTHASDGSEARRAVLDLLPSEELVEVPTECGMLIWWAP